MGHALQNRLTADRWTEGPPRPVLPEAVTAIQCWRAMLCLVHTKGLNSSELCTRSCRRSPPELRRRPQRSKPICWEPASFRAIRADGRPYSCAFGNRTEPFRPRAFFAFCRLDRFPIFSLFVVVDSVRVIRVFCFI